MDLKFVWAAAHWNLCPTADVGCLAATYVQLKLNYTINIMM